MMREDHCYAETISQLYATRVSMNTALAECSDSLLALLSAISPRLESTMQAAMIGNIVTSTVNSKAAVLTDIFECTVEPIAKAS